MSADERAPRPGRARGPSKRGLGRGPAPDPTRVPPLLVEVRLVDGSLRRRGRLDYLERQLARVVLR